MITNQSDFGIFVCMEKQWPYFSISDNEIVHETTSQAYVISQPPDNW